MKALSHLSLAVCLLTFTLAHGEDKLPSDAAALRASYLKARDRALQPLDQKYRDELAKLMQNYTKAGKLNETLAIKAEIDALSPQEASAAPSKTADKLTKRESTKDLIARVWEWHDSGADEDSPGRVVKTVTFMENGTATYAETPGSLITWSIEPNGDLLYQPESAKYKARLHRLPNGFWVGKGYGEMADAIGILHLTPKS